MIILTITIVALVANLITMYKISVQLDRVDDLLIDIEMLTTKMRQFLHDMS